MAYAIVVVLVLILDQSLKYWTVVNLALDTGEKQLIPGIIHLTHVRNTGAAFNLLENARWFLVTVVVIFVIAVIVMLSMDIISGRLSRWMAVLVMAGAIGNGIDRLLYGYVVDMLEFEFINFFPVFNIADIFITCAGIGFCLAVIFHRDKDDGLPAPPVLEQAAEQKRITLKERLTLPESAKAKARRETSEKISRKVADIESAPHQNAQASPLSYDPENPFAEWGIASDTEPVANSFETQAGPDAAREDSGAHGFKREDNASSEKSIELGSLSDVISDELFSSGVETPDAGAGAVADVTDVDDDMNFSLEDILNEFRNND